MLAAMLWALAAPAAAEKNDVLVLANGDKLTGEVRKLDRGKLKLKTDDLGTIYVEWDSIAEITAGEHFDVEIATGEHHFGSLLPAGEEGKVDVVGEDATATLELASVVRLALIQETLWGRVDGSFDFGLSFTKARSTRQLNLNADASYRTRKFEIGFDASSIVTDQEEVAETKRNSLSLYYTRFRGHRWFVAGQGQLQQNEELGLELRMLAGAAAGRYLIQSNRMQLAVSGGLAVSQEQSTVQTCGEATAPEPCANPLSEEFGSTRQSSLEALLGLQFSKFAYDFPATDMTVTLVVFPSLTESGRVRVELDAKIKRELVKDFYLSLSVYASGDSQPPDADAAKNDYGLVTSIGWSF